MRSEKTSWRLWSLSCILKADRGWGEGKAFKKVELFFLCTKVRRREKGLAQFKDQGTVFGTCSMAVSKLGKG